MTVTRSQFREQHKTGLQTNDQQTLDRLKQAGVDGKKLLEGADTNKDGTVSGTGELDKLFNAVDDMDRDGSRHSIGDQKPTAVLSALKGAPPMPGGKVDPKKVDDIYAPDPPPAAGLAKGAKGPEVKAAQEKLMRAGYELPRYGADSDFGTETETAVKKFQKDQKLPETGTLDPTTMQRLDAAPAVKPNAGVKFPEYGEMFKDGVLQTTMAIGYDEGGWDLKARQGALAGLQQRGFEKLDVKNLTDAQLKERGFDPASIDRNATYYTKAFEHDGKPVKALVRLVDRDSPGAKDQFAAGMKKDDLVLYHGHGRRGSGPDFDADKSAAGNYVIGKPYEDGHYALGANDVKKKGALGNNYQMMVFHGCTTDLYRDDIRQVKGRDKLDMLATRDISYWQSGATTLFATLDGVMGGKSINDIEADMERVTGHKGTPGDIWRADGFNDNRYQPRR